MRLHGDILIPAEAIANRVAEIGVEIAQRYEGHSLTLVAVLKGASVFAVDLLRRIDLDVSLEFLRAKSYRDTESEGYVKLTLLPEASLQGKHVLIVEDILDTGRTSNRIMAWAESQQPASVALCAFLDKPSRRIEAMEADFVGFTIEDHFVVGYGLDYNEHYRHLQSIYRLAES